MHPERDFKTSDVLHELPKGAMWDTPPIWRGDVTLKCLEVPGRSDDALHLSNDVESTL